MYLHILKERECSGTLVKVPPLYLISFHPTTGHLSHSCLFIEPKAYQGGTLWDATIVVPTRNSQVIVLHVYILDTWQVAPIFRVTYICPHWDLNFDPIK